MKLPFPTFSIQRGPLRYGFTIGYEHGNHMAWSSLLIVSWWAKDRVFSVFFNPLGGER